MAALMLLVAERPARADEGGNPLAGLEFEALGYFDYSAGKVAAANHGDLDFNRFKVTRGYLTVKKRLTDWASVRVTMDIHQDDTGDYKRREKYFYTELRPPDAGLLTHLKSEIGLGHMPWLDFEEHINPYRAQGPMAIERAGTFNSADVGVSLRGFFGPQITGVKSKTGNSHYGGTYGSWQLGVYNGGGYHAPERNENKLFETRLSARPLAASLPGLQISYLGIFGDGNVAPATGKAAGDVPEFMVNLGMVSYEHPVLIVTGQFFQTTGNASGSWVKPGTTGALKTQGMSMFARVKVPARTSRWNLFGRFDHFDADSDDVIATETAYDMIIGGVACDIHKGNLLLVAYETTDYEANAAGKKKVPSAEPVNLGDDQRLQVVYQIKF